MAALSPADIAHIARIARLRLQPEEQAALAREAAAILGHFEAVMGAPATASSIEAAAPVEPRADEAASPDAAQAEAMVAQFPRRDGRVCKVPGGM